MIKHNVVFLPIGDSRCGDAIAIRIWDTASPSNQTVILIDGGYKDDWEKVIELVQHKFGAEQIDLVISSHLDGDHIAGLVGVVQNFPVKQLWMHLPWEHSDQFLASRQDEFDTMNVTNWLKKSLSNSNDLALAADAAGVPIYEPFAGKSFSSGLGTLTVLGPTRPYYEELLPQILDKSASKATSSIAPVATSVYADLASILKEGAKIAKENILESHDHETLSDEGDTTPSNNSSTVLLLELSDGSKKLLFTGDAGKQALTNAHLEYVSKGHSAGELSFVQVPHHGSRRNVGPAILDKLLGLRTDNPDDQRGVAFVSAVENCTADGHPKKSATNAFRRRGYPVYMSGNNGVKHGHELDGYNSPASPLPLFTEVEG